jgi:hypothetical protein
VFVDLRVVAVVCHHELLRNFFADETGATAIEYGLIATGIAIAIIAAVGTRDYFSAR